MIHYRARVVLPIAGPPLHDGWVAVENGRIHAVGQGPVSGSGVVEQDLGHVALLPGLINAHTHLELSHLRDTIPPSSDFVGWIRGVLGARRATPDPGSTVVLDGIAKGIAECLRCGTAAVGDISNTLVPFAALAASPLAGVIFYELIRFNAPDPDAFVRTALDRLSALAAQAPPTSSTSPARVRASLAAHAPYSVAPAVFRAIASAMARAPGGMPWSVHLSESPAETEFIATGRGSWRDLLEQIGSWDPGWTAPGVSPVAYLDQQGVLGPRTIAVHGVQMTPDDLARLAARGATLVTCPRSNQHTGAGTPPIAAFYASGARVAVGTDSLASTADLNLFAELAAMRTLAPDVPASWLLDSATRRGAEALALDADYGTLRPGRVARLLTVRMPHLVDDVEEYLVSGVSPDQIAWVA